MKACAVIIAGTVLLAGCTFIFTVSPVNQNTHHTAPVVQPSGTNFYAFPAYQPGPFFAKIPTSATSTIKKSNAGNIRINVKNEAELCELCTIECPDEDSK